MAEASSCLQGKSLKHVWECEDSFAVWSRAVNPCAEAEGVSSQLGWAVDPHSHPHLSVCVCTDLHRDPRGSACSEAVTDTETYRVL